MTTLETILADIDAAYGVQVAIIERTFERDMHAGKDYKACADDYHSAMRAAWELRNVRFDRACGWIE